MDTIKLKDVKEDRVYNILRPWGKGYTKGVGRLFRANEHQVENVYMICDDGGVSMEKPAEVIFVSEIGKVK